MLLICLFEMNTQGNLVEDEPSYVDEKVSMKVDKLIQNFTDIVNVKV